MTEEQQIIVSKLLKQKSELLGDLSKLTEPKVQFDLCLGHSWLYSIPLYCSKDKDLNDLCKGIVIKFINDKILEIDKQLEQI